MDKGMHPWKTIRDATIGFALSLAVLPGSAIALNIQPGSSDSGLSSQHRRGMASNSEITRLPQRCWSRKAR